MRQLIAIISGVLLIASCGTQSTGTEKTEQLDPAPVARKNVAVDRADAAESVSRSFERMSPPDNGHKLVQGVLDRQAQIAAEKAAREAEVAKEVQSAKTPQVQSSGNLPPLLLLIRSHESGGNYGAYNGGGCEGYGCGGAYQLHARYASAWAAEAGFSGMPSNAAQWPPATQDAVALYKFNQTNGGLWCDWVDYC